MDRICGNCGTDISDRRADAEYCSRNCKGAASQRRKQQAARADRVKQPLVCIDCGGIFQRNADGRQRKRCNSCNPSYIECALCGNRCRPNPGEVQCVKCRTELKVLAADKPLEHVAGCLTCEKPFVQTARRSEYCSDKCAKTGYRRNDRAAWHARRAAQYGAAAEMFQPIEIFERDNWICQLCDIPVNPAVEVPHPFAPTQDHIIPLNKGGHHTRENVQLAHFYCNSVKQDQEDPEQRLGLSEPATT